MDKDIIWKLLGKCIIEVVSRQVQFCTSIQNYL